MIDAEAKEAGIVIGGHSNIYGEGRKEKVLFVFQSPGDKPGRDVQFNVWNESAKSYEGVVRVSLDSIPALIEELKSYLPTEDLARAWPNA
jgi:hypothetical protein